MEMLILSIIAFICLTIATPLHGIISSNRVKHAVDAVARRPLSPKDGELDESTSVQLHHDQAQISTHGYHKFGGGVGSVDTHSYVGQEQIQNDYKHGNIIVPDKWLKEYNQNCDRNMATMTCRIIPTRLLSNVTTLIVTAQETAIPVSPFQDPSFNNLSYLFLNGNGFSDVSYSCFFGLEGLIHLTLTGMRTLHGSSLQSAVSRAVVLPKMNHFALNPGEAFQLPFLKVEKTFLTKLANNYVECVNLSNVIIEVKFQDMLEYALRSNLSIVNLTGSFLIIDYSSLSEESNEIQTYSLEKPLLRTLDISRLRSTNITRSYSRSSEIFQYTPVYHSNCNVTPEIFPQFFLVETLYLRKTLTDLTNYYGYCDLSSYDVFWKKIVISGNYMTKLNVTFNLPKKTILQSVDLSNNKLKYVSPGVFSSAFAMTELLLSHNELDYMQYLPEFEKLLTAMTRLSVFDLANNNITFIPSKMFRYNKHLKKLNLSNNRLKSITFELKALINLRLLDIRGNAIVALDHSALNKLQLIFQASQKKLVVLFAGNPIQCSCESVSFIAWLVSIQGVTKEHILLCDYEHDNIKVDKDAAGKCEFLCHRTVIIAVSTVCSLVVVTVLLSATGIIKHIKVRKKKKTIEMQLRELIEEGSFACFMAVSGNDEPVVDRVILENLRPLLQCKFGIDRDLVCTGYKFKLGVSICEEAYRLIKKCQVFVAVVSESFLRSQYCMLEFQEAVKQNKPTILIFLGHVQTTDMPQFMQEVFKRRSRAWIKQNDEGYYYVVPNLIDMCDAIWDLAVADLLYKI